MVNSGDPEAATAYGLTPQHFRTHRDEFEWVTSYYKRYGAMPSREKLKATFAEFPFDREESDPRWSAQEIQEKYAQQELMKKITAANDALDRKDVSAAYACFSELSYSQHLEKPTNLLMDPGYFESFDASDEVRIEMPWRTLDNLTGGIGPGELWYMLARQGQGKSSMLVNIAVNAAQKGRKVLFYALEMTKRQLQVRAHAVMGHKLGWGDQINAHAMLHRSFDRTKYERLVAEIEGNIAGELHVVDLSAGPCKPANLMAVADQYDLIIVDHVGLMMSDSNARSISDWRAAAEISNGLKEVTGAKNARVLAAVQINREGETHNWRPPELKYASQTDAIGQDADVAVTMKRYGNDAMVLSLEKNRHGESKRIFYTDYLPNWGRFDEISRDQADDSKARSADDMDD